ncbi:MAG TPA: deoxyribonuclease IV [Gaiellaceae bacterium]|nr:deoxyribonuclease IV [Gaiellaceae bacterium]
MSSSGGIFNAIDRIEAIGGDCVQVFTQSPRMWRPTNHTEEAIEKFKERRREAGIGGVVVHALYLVNLAAPNDEIYEKSIATMRTTMDVSNAIEADAVIFHVGSHLGAGFEVGLDRTAHALEQILERADGETWLCMENSAGAGATIGRSVEELETLVQRLGGHERLGLCLDSCHLYASGYDVTDRDELDQLVRQIDASVGLDRVRALHINDSATPLGSNRDRHADVGKGLMGEGLGVFLAHPAFQHLSAYLETPGPDKHGPDANEIQKLRDLHARATR